MVLFSKCRCEFTSQELRSEGQNRAKTLEGLQKIKSVNAVLVFSLTSEHMFGGPLWFLKFWGFPMKILLSSRKLVIQVRESEIFTYVFCST